ncbi:Hypothetical predicted protein, partial [Paramuricea clavata]
MNDFDQPEGAEGGDEGVLDDTPVNEDDFRSGLDGNDRLDDAKTSSFQYIRRLQESKYNINANDGPVSRNLLSSLDITKNKLTFKGVEVAYIDTNGIYRFSTNKRYKKFVSEFDTKFNTAVFEHIQKPKSVVEEETEGESSGVTTEDILEDAREELRQETVNAGDNLNDHAERLGSEGKITTQERREFVGVTSPKGPPEVRIKALREQKKVFETNIELATDPERRQIMQEGRDVVEQ